MLNAKHKRNKKTKVRTVARISGGGAGGSSSVSGASGSTSISLAQRRVIIPRPDVLHNYLEYSQVNQYLDYIVHRYPHFVKLYTLGTTHEKREVRALEINWNNPENNELPSLARMQATKRDEVFKKTGNKGPLVLPGDVNRNIIFIEAGTHAREWITVSTCLNCIYQLTERYTRNIEVLRNLRFIIVPLVNPDGYEYSRKTNRNWRKNRRPHKGSKFVGTDCNRNYDIYWECGPSKTNRNTYKGERPFSEPETRAMRNILDSLAPNLLFFLSLHSYGQSIMYPWGYSRDPPHHWRELSTLANTGRTAIKSYNGREYRTGSISALTKRTISGSVVDYVYGVLNAPLALVMELPSRALGFQPPVEMISQIGHESWFGIREMCKSAFDLRNKINRSPESNVLPNPKLRPRAEAGAGDSKLASDDSSDKEQHKVAQKKKKRTKRSLISHHEQILELQKRRNALLTASAPVRPVTAPAIVTPATTRAAAASAAATTLSGQGQGDGPTNSYFVSRIKAYGAGRI
ncbi:CG8564 [Drosophila busckii]|uniref:CG8564 n=1 Tax=Drosophila busckii TaxID=30019 RepID=A0A0M4EHU4_DROBS|nr:carboxypeptidase B [Drosophila busckii]ALC43326.1 CG8564 [Drosophila busckii]